MKFIGTKDDLIKRWVSEAAIMRDLAETAKTPRQRELFLIEARMLEKCALELEMMTFETDQDQPDPPELAEFSGKY